MSDESAGHWRKLWETWDLRTVILLSLALQTLLIFCAPLRKRVSSAFLSTPMWLAYLLADITATYALGIISKSQSHAAYGPFSHPDLLAFWAPFLLVHLGGPDTITAFALEDNELWLRHLLSLGFQTWAVVYSIILSIGNTDLRIPTILMLFAGLIKYTERTRSLYLASTRRFRNSLLTDPDPGPNYAKLMDEYSSKIEGNLPTRIEMIPEPQRIKTTGRKVIPLFDLQIVQSAHNFFDTFRGLIADLIFSFRERADSRDFFLQRNARDAFKVVEVELNFFYEILYTKVVVVQGLWGTLLRGFSLGFTWASLVLFYLFHKNKKHNVKTFDIGITYTLLIGAIALDFIAFLMVLFSDWTAVALTNKSNFWTKSLGKLLRVKRDRWPAEKEGTPSIFHKIMGFVGLNTIMVLIRRRWSESLSQYNLINYCLNPRSKWLDKVIGWVGLTNMVDGFVYVNSIKITNEMEEFIFEELKMKAEVADDLETSKEINSAKGDWILRFEGCDNLLPWVNEVDFDECLLLWHIATELCVSTDEDGVDVSNKDAGKKSNKTKKKDFQVFAKQLSDYVLYLLMMQSTMMSTVAGIGEIRFRDTCEEAKKFFKGRNIKKTEEKCCHCFCRRSKEKDNDMCCINIFPFQKCFCADGIVNREKPNLDKKKNQRVSKDGEDRKVEKEKELRIQACESILKVNTAVKPVAVKGDRSKSVLFDACMLAKELKKLKGEKKWKIMSKVWVELLCYAACRCRATRHAAQLSKGGQLITLVWLMMAHFGLGNQFQISEGHARAKLIVGK